ncbi:PRC-barrel domain-containing protein [Sagittula sp. SSi028]|uniref:PRC-barrel domain-containing protein n=1 Tax=Sagittula sp. SSi028 TaxID=3400636 RepID=UPI003AF79218
MTSRMTRKILGSAAFALAGSAGIAFAQSSDTDADETATCAELNEVLTQADVPEAVTAELQRTIDAGDNDECSVVLEDLESAGGLHGYVLIEDESSEDAGSGEIDNTPYTTAAQGEVMPESNGDGDAKGAGAYSAAADADPIPDTVRSTPADLAQPLKVEDVMGLPVYDANGESIGEVEDVVTRDDGSIDRVIMDIGGFLRLGTHTVALPLVDLFVDTENGDPRATADYTEDQLRDMPEYEG